MEQQPPKKVKLEATPHTYYRATEGDVTFVVVSNDLSIRNVSWLISLKEIFAKQLPKMKEEYIISLVFDARHQSLLCFDSNNNVVGGIAFKPFHTKRFAEIAFCAVTDMVQVRGFGAKLMTHLKEYSKRVNILHFLTYADNDAIGYFQKQGFSADIALPKEVYAKEIKYYAGSQLMECVILPKVDYFQVKDLVQAQRDMLVSKVAKRKQIVMCSSGFDSAYSAHVDEDKEPVMIQDAYNTIPGLREAGWREPLTDMLVEMSAKTFHGDLSKSACRTALMGEEEQDKQAAMLQAWELISKSDGAWPFHEPVPVSLTSYFELIRDPMDLSLIRERIVNGGYAAADGVKAMARDLTLMCDNCKMFNPSDSDFYQAAVRLQDAVNELFEK